MLTLLFYILLHCLFWGAVGAVVAQRAHVSRWLGAIVSIVLPVIGSLVLLIIAARQTDAPQGAVAKSWRAWGWAGVAGGLAIAAAAWLSWPDARLGASAVDRELLDFGLHVADLEQLALIGTLTGLAIAGCSYAVVRTGRRAWAIGAAALAWLPTFTAGLLILSEGFIDDMGEKAEHAANVVEVVQVAQAEVDAEYSIGAGPYLCLLGGLAVLVWVAYWSLRAPGAPLPSVSDYAVQPAGYPTDDWTPTGRQSESDGWDDWASPTSQPPSDNRSEWEW